MAENNIASGPGARRMIGRVLGIGIIAAAAVMVVVTLVQWEIRPQTDDATVRANFVGIAPQVNGHIVELHVRDNQMVKEGDLLFLIDPRPYQIALERARATLALTRKEVDGLRNSAATAVAGVSKAEAQLNASASEVTRREMDPVVADAEIARLEAQFQNADDHLKRLEPLLPLQFVTTDNVEKARTVRAPVTGLVVNMNISNGAFARTGAEVFTLLDTRTWYVVANFRETQLKHIPAGAPVDVYLQSQPSRHFRGTVVGLGWAVLPENGTSVNGLPRVERSLDWIRLAARFPVRIKVEDPDESFRIGASAVATVHGSLRTASR